MDLYPLLETWTRLDDFNCWPRKWATPNGLLWYQTKAYIKTILTSWIRRSNQLKRLYRHYRLYILVLLALRWEHFMSQGIWDVRLLTCYGPGICSIGVQCSTRPVNHTNPTQHKRVRVDCKSILGQSGSIHFDTINKCVRFRLTHIYSHIPLTWHYTKLTRQLELPHNPWTKDKSNTK